ncbi:tetraacyldisaccharide 4'-kinase [Daejeonella lutea]|nr:tetraacyldisaccharide 4'-kinase [Daejeonella lutea]
MKPFRLLLFPFSLIYGLGVMARNLAFDLGVLKSTEFDIPIISVGNLSVGGSGKSPMTEYLVRLLKDKYKISTLSRGYGRRSKGFRLVEQSSLSTETGDEPLQFKRKFKDITVAVCENRVDAIKRLRTDHELVILDDAYQHRKLRPGLSILLFDYNSISNFKMLLPAGDLREPVWEKDRADILVITKTPPGLDQADRQEILSMVKPRNQQEIFYSYLEYGNLKPFNCDMEERTLLSIKVTTQIILLTGIANPAPLLSEIGGYTQLVTHHKYADHHNFNKKNISKLVQAFNSAHAEDKIIITTEKDAQRLGSAEVQELLKSLPVYYLPVEAEIHEPEKARFNELIEKYAAEPTVDH